MTAMQRPFVAVVVLVYRSSDNKILIGQRKGVLGEGAWELPGGSMEYGETFDTSCQREVKEETGLDVTDIRLVTAKNIIFEQAHKHFVSLFFAAQCVDADPVPKLMEPDKSGGWVWTSWSELRERKYSPLFGILNDLVDEYPQSPWLVSSSGPE
ncbi:hypothetical protein IWQ60_006104 [Tieghemiomyces parasiticus]|uniref:Nudix hydrolase domain-containing protein n=1 Tax=Tieghemiomyces parasiticus TaxID=78921 RepID=A0A9W8A7X5_9FUNG|nr:hypothetical protein IWQ60_006104 [Tieghemiomyces parasiticus]